MTSPDGRWRWDGVAWVPNVAAPRRQGMQARWVVLIAVGTLAALVIAAAGIVMAGRLGQAIQRTFAIHSTAACLPSDFPTYPGAVRNFAYTVGKLCTEAYVTVDAPDQVASYYQSQLSVTPWRLTRTRIGNTVYFGRDDSESATGELQALKGHAGGAQITITYLP
jgi:hypothetical protein